MTILVIRLVLGEGRRCLFSNGEKGERIQRSRSLLPRGSIILQPSQPADGLQTDNRHGVGNKGSRQSR